MIIASAVIASNTVDERATGVRGQKSPPETYLVPPLVAEHQPSIRSKTSACDEGHSMEGVVEAFRVAAHNFYQQQAEGHHVFGADGFPRAHSYEG